MPELIDTKELMKRTGFRRTKIQEMRDSRAIPFLKFNKRCIRYRWTDVLAAIERRTVKAI